MNTPNDFETLASINEHKAPVWKIIVQNVFGAAFRLHQYRDQRDSLLRRVLLDHERALDERRCCNE